MNPSAKTIESSVLNAVKADHNRIVEINLYWFGQDYRLSDGQISDALQRLRRKGLVELDSYGRWRPL